METVVYLSSTGLQVIQGQVSHGQVHVDYFQDYSFLEGTMLDGVIIDDGNIQDVLKNLKTRDIQKVRLVVDSGKIFIKSEKAPKLNHKELKQFVKNEFVDVDLQDVDMLYDYAVVEEKLEKQDGQMVLCAAMEKDFIDGYMSLFKEAGIEIESIDLLTNAVIKLTQSIDALKNKTYVLSYVNGNDVNNYLFVDGHYAMTNRCRIFSDRGSVAFVTEVTNALTKLIQFFKGQYKDNVIEHIYFAGLDAYEEDLLLNTVTSSLEKQASRFDVEHVDNQTNKDFFSHKFLAIGSLYRLKKNQDIDFLNVYFDKGERFEKSKTVMKWVALPLVLVLLFAGATGYLIFDNHQKQNQVDKLNQELAQVIVDNNAKIDVEKETEYQDLQAEVAALQRANDLLNSYPQISKATIDAINSSCTNVTLESMSFEQESGQITISLHSNRVDGCQEAVRHLRESGYFSDVQYSGYSQSGGVSETTTPVTDPLTGEVTYQTSTTETPVTYTTSVTCILGGGSNG